VALTVQRLQGCGKGDCTNDGIVAQQALQVSCYLLRFRKAKYPSSYICRGTFTSQKKRVCVTYSIVSPLRSSLRPTSQASISGIRKSRYHFPHTHNELAIRNLEIVLVRPHTTNFTVTTRSSLNSYQPSLTSTTKFMSPVGTSSMNNV
jgi:hypothetical protein